jgi:aldehyde dehydrogenase (NAD+)
MEGGVDVSTQLLSERWDYIFSQVVYPWENSSKVRRNVNPPLLHCELGGKSPCVR